MISTSDLGFGEDQMKKVIPIVIAAAMLMVVFAAGDSDATVDSLWVNGHEVTGDTENAGEHWSYVASTNTLTLSGVNFTAEKYDADRYTSGCIFDGRDGTLKIVLSGENTIAAPEGSHEVNGIFVSDSVEISGSGSLAISAPDGNGIMAFHSITLKSGTVTMNGCATFGLFAAGAYPLEKGVVNIQGGTLNLGNDHIDVNGSVAMSGGTINFNGGPMMDILDINGGDFVMTGGTINIASSAADDLLINAETLINLNGAELTNVTPKKYDGGWVVCDIAEATGLFATEAGASVITHGDSPDPSGDDPKDDDKKDNKALYIGGGVGAAVLVIAIVGAFLFLRKR